MYPCLNYVLFTLKSSLILSKFFAGASSGINHFLIEKIIVNKVLTIGSYNLLLGKEISVISTEQVLSCNFELARCQVG